MDPPAGDHYKEAKRRRSSSSANNPATFTRRRSEAIASRYVALILVLSITCTVTTLLIFNRLTPYFELISTTIDQPSLQTSEATSKSFGATTSTPVEPIGIDAQLLNPSLGLTVQNATPHIIELPNEENIHTIGFSPGHFCSFCNGTNDFMCTARRLDFVMKRYNLNESAATAILLEKCTTSTILQNMNTKDDEPSIILHVGPHKTGTTALQSFIYDMVKLNNNTLLEDNLRIPLFHELPGIYKENGVGLNLAQCSINRYERDGGRMSKALCGIPRKTFPEFVVDAYNKSQNILVVAEDFDMPEIDFNRLDFFLHPYKKIKVISTYRRLHDWLPSWYNQIVDLYKVEYARGNDTYPSFVEWLEEKYDIFLPKHGIPVAERFQSYEFVESVNLINMHDVGESLVGTFFCDVLQANKTCNAIKGGMKPSKPNIGSDHDFERLAIEAKLAGIIPASSLAKRVKIRQVSKFLMSRVEQTHTSLPRLCPSNETLDRILTQTLEHERKYLPVWFESQGGEEALRESFEKAVRKKFCVIDVNKIFDTGIMDDIFRQVK